MDSHPDFHKAKILWQRAADVYAKVAETAFRLGDKAMLLDVVSLYLNMDVLPPKWARDELVGACLGDTKSWNDVFGKRRKRKRTEVMGGKAYREAQRLREQPGYKISDDSPLFPELGKILGVSAGRAKDYYYKGGAKHRAEALSVVAAKLMVPEDRAGQDPTVLLVRQAEVLLQSTEAIVHTLRELTSEKPALKTRINKSASGGRHK